jgi:hypothetical protein
MGIARVLRIVSLAAALALLTSVPPTALADNVVADDQIVQGNLCVGTPCIDGQVFDNGGNILIKGVSPRITFEDTNGAVTWRLVADASNAVVITQIPSGGIGITHPFRIITNAPTHSLWIASDGKVGLGTGTPSQQLHVLKDQNANTFFLVQNATNGLNANAVVRTQADTAIQNFQSHATSRTLVRWGVPLGGWNEFLSVAGNGLAMGTLNTLPLILGTGATPRMSFDGDSNVISFGGGGQYDGNSFNDASSRTLKQDIRPLGPDAAIETLAGLEPVTFAYTGAPGDPRVGFVAEDVPELVATPGRKTLSALEIVAVLTRVVQEQQKALVELTTRLATLEARP